MISIFIRLKILGKICRFEMEFVIVKNLIVFNLYFICFLRTFLRVKIVKLFLNNIEKLFMVTFILKVLKFYLKNYLII